MLPQEIIRIKRDGGKLSDAHVHDFISGVTSKTVSEGQVAAFCMAVLLKGMDMQERVALTQSMARSGAVMEWASSCLPGPVLDKHSTGGVGDKVSLMLAPLVAACGGYVPMLSGRGLGHTGGTLDKMDSIPGYKSQPEMDLFRKTVKDAGCAIIGATPDLAPADRIMYAIRDVTATVESLDLITASILSKKMAAGLSGLVMDVKFGSGAFMQKYEDAQVLAQSIVDVANGAGLRTVGLLTDMNQVLGRTAGNAVEVLEAAECLKGDHIDSRLHKVTTELAAELLLLGELAKDLPEARKKVQNALETGVAAERFAKMVADLGGPADFMEKPEKHLKAAAVIRDVMPVEKGQVAGMDVRALGIGIVELGGGRARPSDAVDHTVGLTHIARVGEEVGTGSRPLARIHARDEGSWQKMADTLLKSVIIAGQAAGLEELIRMRIAA